MAQARIENITASSVYSYSQNFSESDTSLGDSYLCDVSDSSVTQDLRKIVVTVGFDSDHDNSLDQDEQLISLSTLLAKRI